MTMIKQARILFQTLNEKGSVDNANIASNSEARSWLQELKSEGYVRYDKKNNSYILLKEIPEEISDC